MIKTAALSVIAAALVINSSQAATGGMIAADAADRMEFWRYLATQSGLLVALLITLWFYRRDFLRQVKEKDGEVEIRKQEVLTLSSALRDSTAALRESAVATTRQTDATHRLAKIADSLDRRLSFLAPGSPRRQEGN